MSSGCSSNSPFPTYPAITLEELTTFLNKLTVERETFKTPTAKVLQSVLLVVRKKGDQIIGMGGVRWYWLTPVSFCVVLANYQSSGYGYSIGQEIGERSRGRFPFLCSIILNKNHAGIHLAKKRGYKECLWSYKYHFMFLPISRWSYMVYPLYSVFFPLLFLTYYFCKNHLASILALVKGPASSTGHESRPGS